MLLHDLIRSSPLNSRRGPFQRRLLVLGFIAVVSLLTFIDWLAPAPPGGYKTGGTNVITKLPLYRFREYASSTQREKAVPTSSPATTKAKEGQSLRDTLFPIRDPSRHSGNNWIDENHRTLKALFTCIELDTCRPNQGKIVILHSYHFKGALWGWNGGEDVWARSVITALQHMGYSYLYAEEPERALQLYQMFPDLVKAVIMEESSVYACFSDKFPCRKNHDNPDGIPSWKIFSFYFWANHNHPMGNKWTLAPEDYSTEWDDEANTYVGYSVELSCKMHPKHTDREWFVPDEERPEGQIYIMAKRLSYFAPTQSRAWALEAFEQAAERVGARFIAGAQDDAFEHPGMGVPTELPKAITNYGLLPQDEFIDALAHSRLLVGVGNPVLSPTPYEALCLGVPFINPIMRWDPKNPTNRRAWDSQHIGLKYLNPPYVYNVLKDDVEGFVQAVEHALANPIEKTILPRMTIKAVTGRLKEVLERDWKAEAAKLLEERRRNGGELFIL